MIASFRNRALGLVIAACGGPWVKWGRGSTMLGLERAPVLRGTDVDKLRNLAKSVTVE